MSSASNTTSTSFNSEAIFNAALTEYTKRTGKDLSNHPLASKIDSCNNPESILDIFQEQAHAFDEFRNGDTKLFRWLRPAVGVLHAISTNKAFSDGVSHVSPATSVILLLDNLSSRCFRPQRQSSPLSIYCYPCVSSCYLRPTLCHIQNRQTAKDVRASYDALVDIFECIENFLRRLSIYNEIPPTPAMTEMVIKIIAELITALALATKQMKQGRFSMSTLANDHLWLIL
jgi:hypothetical protein